MVTRGFTGHQSRPELSSRIPPGQHLVDNFPVLTAGPTPRIEPADWNFTLKVGIVHETGNPPQPGRFDVALRVHAPPGDPPADAPLEPVPLFGAAGPDPDLLRGLALPAGYLAAPDLPHRCTVGRVDALGSHEIGP